MLYTNLDQVVRRTLLERGWPIHYLLESLCHAATCVRQLSTDTLQIINTVKLPINSYGAVDLPSDFTDDLAVAFNISGVLQKIPHNENINPLRSIDSDGNFVPYSETALQDSALSWYGIASGWGWFWNINDYGEPTGRFFGVGGGTSVGYKVIKERRQIQLTQDITEGEILLMYISDGMRADNATQVDVFAWDAINAFILWQRSPNAANERSPEASSYYNQKRLLRARLDPTTPEDIKNIVRKNTHAAIKG